MARMVIRPGNHLREKRLEWKPRVEKICLDMVAVAKYLKVYTYGRGDAAAKLLSHVRLCESLWNCSPPGSSVHGILQVRIREWVAMPFSRELPDSGIEPESPALQPDSLPSEPLG